MLGAVAMFRVVELPAASILDAVRVVTPAGAPDTESVSGALKDPCTRAHDTCMLAACPAVRLMLVGRVERLQAGGTATTNVTDTFLATPPPFALMLTG